MAASNRRRSKRRRKDSIGWAWLAVGLAIGLLAAFLVYLKVRPQAEDTASPLPLDPAGKQEQTKDIPVPPPIKPRFDFYTILPEMEVVVPEQDLGRKTEAGVREVEKPGVYLLQVGSFRSYEQADQLKAKLVLMGLEVGIQSVATGERETWHRVRVGPYQDLEALNRARVRLREQSIDAILLQVRE